MSGQIGLMISIARARASGGGADISITIYGSVSVDVFSGLVNARGTISGILTFYNFKLSPTFGWSRVTFGIEIRVSVRISVAEFHVACTMQTDGGWTVDITLGHFFGLGNCFQNNWFRRRHWCEHYPRRRNSLMDQWCWGPGWWCTCGEFGSTPYPGCRSGFNPLCLNDIRRRRRRRTRRRNLASKLDDWR